MRAVAALLLSLAVLAGAARADEPSAIEVLISNARHWQARGRDDRAAEAWAKVLRSSPAEAEALVALGTLHAHAGRADKARELLARLRAAHPDSPELAALERAITVGKEFDSLLAQARTLVKAGKIDEALALYRQLFGDGSPPAHLALEYWQTLGGTADGWKDARDGLAQLAARYPGEPAYRLALARHLTYREEARREGVTLLLKLEEEGALLEEVSPALRKGLLWLHLGPGDDGLLARFLKAHPADVEVQKRRAAHRRGESKASPVAKGFEALEKSEVDKADKLFKSAQGGDKGPDVEALVGQGIVALKREDFARARDLFAKVKALAPGKPELWERSLRSATFWSLMKDAQLARTARKDEEAEALLQQAMKASPDERHHAELQLADLSASQGDDERAEVRLRELLGRRPDEVEALRQLVNLLLRTARGEEALAVNERLAHLDARQAFAAGWLESERLRLRAADERRAGKLDQARTDLLAAREADAENRWALHDLADFYLVTGDLAPARAALQQLLTLEPTMPEARIARARLLAAGGATAQALEALQSMKGDLTPALRQLQKRLEFQLEVDAVTRRALRGRRDTARADLLGLQQRTLTSPETAAVVAQAWSTLGDHTRAVSVMNEAIEASSKPGAGMKLQLAAILLKANQDQQLAGLLGELHADPTLLPVERKGLMALRVAHAVRRADRYREESETSLAYTALAPLLAEYPDEPRLLNALGRLFQTANRPAEGNHLFARLVALDPDDLEALQGAIETAVQLRELDQARALLAEAVRRSPRDPRRRLVAGRFSVRTGDDAEAIDHFQEAQTLLELENEAKESGGESPGFIAESSTQALLRQASRIFQPERGGRSSAEGLGIREEIEDEIAKVRSRHTVDASAGTELRQRNGVAGLGQLTGFRFPIEGSVPLGYRGRLSVRVTPVMLDAGPLDYSTALIVDQYGSASQAPQGAATQVQRTARGTELRLGYAQGGLQLDVGSTPLGFPLQTVTGGASFRTELGGLGLAAEASRRPLTDSVLSYAGQHDPITGQLWGGVIANGGRADLAILSPGATYYLWGSVHQYVGTGVERNQSGAVGLGTEWKLNETVSGTAFVTGFNVTALGYQKNLRYFTLGHGGYFSPQSFVHAGVPLTVRGVSGKLSYDVSADAGINWFKETGNSYFPIDSERQAARQDATDPTTNAPLAAGYPEKTSLSFAFSARARLVYALADRLEAVGSFDLHRADDYQEVTAGALLRFRFGGRARESAPYRDLLPGVDQAGTIARPKVDQ